MRYASVFVVLLAGCGSQDGDILARVFRKTGEKLEAAAGGSPNQFAGRLRSNASPIGLADRVKTRLQWDRYLEGVEIQVESTAEGVVKVKGKVGDQAKKQRVIDLALKSVPSVEPGILFVERQFGVLELHSHDLGELTRAGDAVLKGIGARAGDQLKPRVLFSDVIEEVTD